jgi:hypothetical protein
MSTRTIIDRRMLLVTGLCLLAAQDVAKVASGSVVLRFSNVEDFISIS